MKVRTHVSAMLATALPLAGCGLFDSSLLKACEMAMQDRLRSPSTYNRLDVDEGEDLLSADEYLKETFYPGKSDISIKLDRESIERGDTIARRLYAIVTYEASNAYGTPIRNRYICEYYTTQTSPSVYDTLVRIDGETNTDRLLRELKEAR